MRFVALIATITLLLAACNIFNPPSEDYRNLMKLPPEQWVQFASQLPVEQRLNLYEEVYDRSSHPPDVRLSPAFVDDPEDAYVEVARRLETSDSPDRYYPILFEIENASHETMCQPGRREFIERTLMRGSDTHPFSGLFSKPC